MGCDGFGEKTSEPTTVSLIPPDGFYRFASSIVDMPHQGQDDAENMITADAGGVISFRKTGVMQTIQYEMHVPPNALNQDQQISLRLKDTYAQGVCPENCIRCDFYHRVPSSFQLFVGYKSGRGTWI